MASIFNHVQSTTSMLSSETTQISPFIWVAFTSFQKLHRIWHYYQKMETYTNPNNFFNLLSGHALAFSFENNLILKVSAQCILIATRILQCAEQKKIFCNAYEEWIDSLKGRCRSYFIKELETVYSPSLLSPSTVCWLTFYKQRKIFHTKRIVSCTQELLKTGFQLSMSLMDAIQAFSLNPETSHEGMQMIFVNGEYCADTLIKKQEESLNSLKENKLVIDGILKQINPSYNADQMIKTFENLFKKTATLHATAKKISLFGNGIIKEAAQNLAFNFMVTIGCSKHIPNWIVPPM